MDDETMRTIGKRFPVGWVYARLMGCSYGSHDRHYVWKDDDCNSGRVMCRNCGVTGHLNYRDGGTARAVEVWFEMHEKEDE